MYCCSFISFIYVVLVIDHELQFCFAFQEYIAQRSPDFRKTFVKFDSDGDGKISRKEFRMVSTKQRNLMYFSFLYSVPSPIFNGM